MSAQSIFEAVFITLCLVGMIGKLVILLWKKDYSRAKTQALMILIAVIVAVALIIT